MGLFMKIVILVTLFVVSIRACGYESCPAHYDPAKLNIHIISHAHEDVGWLKTPDGYADGDVSPMLSHVTEELMKNPNRKFTLVEIYYIKRWWQRQSSATKENFRKLIKNGQFAFANGGWVANDEAPAHYNDIIDQLTLGIEFIRNEFGDCALPKVSWQIDAFGHSREMANLYAQMGFDGHVTHRGTHDLRNEFMWNASHAHSIFTTKLHAYSSPKGFDFESHDNVTEENKHEKADAIVKIGKDWNHQYGSKGHIMILFGDDNKYKNAEHWYTNLDKLIEVVNHEHADVNILYSTPNCYVKAVLDLKPKLDVRSQDYHPFWSGFYTSRPVVKYLNRYTNNLLQSAKQLEVVAELGNTQALIYEGKNQMAVLQHHDAITGTSRPHVMDDYKQRLVSAIKATSSVISQALEKLTKKNQNSTKSQSKPFIYTTVNISDFTHHFNFNAFATIIYNPLVQEHSHSWVRIPVGDQHVHKVFNSDGQEVSNVSFVPISQKVRSMVGHHKQVTHELVFEAHLPALGFTTFFVTKDTEKPHENKYNLTVNGDQDYVLKGKNIELVVNRVNGETMYLVKNGKRHRFVQKFLYYPANSAVWEFCPTSGAIDLSDFNSKLVHAAQYEGFAEVTQKVNDWVWQTIRVYEDREEVEFDWVVGPLPEEGHINHEVVTRFETDVQNGRTFYTDANGRQNMKRIRNDTMRGCLKTQQSITYNFYPVTTRAILKDEQSGDQLIFIPDRSVGGASLQEGQMEFLIHRRIFGHLFLDVNMDDRDVDGLGIVARGKFYVTLANKNEAADRYRQMSRNILLQPIIAFTQIDSIDQYRNDSRVHFSALKSPLPDSVHLLTMENWGNVRNNEVLVRFENIYDHDDEGSKWNAPVSVGLDAFAQVKPEQVFKSNLVVSGREKVDLNVTLEQQEIVNLVYKVDRNVTNSVCTEFKWEKLTGNQLPAHAILAGHDANTSIPFYICRHKNVDLLPGKFSVQHHCHVSYGGKDFEFNDADVEILTAADSSATYQWVPRHGGDSVHENAFVAGQRTDTGAPIYVGRCAKHGLVIGKIDEYFYYGFDGKESRDCVDYEILTC